MSILSKTLGLNLPPPREVLHSLMKQKREQEQADEQDSNPEEPHGPAEQPQEVARVTYILQTNGNIAIVPSWHGESPQIATAFANLLFLINDGYVATETRDILKMYAQHNICSIEFVETTIKAWANLFSKVNHQAVLRPSMVLKSSRILPKRQQFSAEDDNE